MEIIKKKSNKLETILKYTKSGDQIIIANFKEYRDENRQKIQWWKLVKNGAFIVDDQGELFYNDNKIDFPKITYEDNIYAFDKYFVCISNQNGISFINIPQSSNGIQKYISITKDYDDNPIIAKTGIYFKKDADLYFYSFKKKRKEIIWQGKTRICNMSVCDQGIIILEKDDIILIENSRKILILWNKPHSCIEEKYYTTNITPSYNDEKLFLFDKDGKGIIHSQNRIVQETPFTTKSNFSFSMTPIGLLYNNTDDIESNIEILTLTGKKINLGSYENPHTTISEKGVIISTLNNSGKKLGSLHINSHRADEFFIPFKKIREDNFTFYRDRIKIYLRAENAWFKYDQDYDNEIGYARLNEEKNEIRFFVK